MYMKKLLLPFLATVLLNSGIDAQERETSVVCVTYDAIHVSDTNNRDKSFKEEMLLIVGPHYSKYVNNDNRAAIKKMRQAPPSNTPMRVVAGAPMAVVNAYGITNTELFQDPAGKKLAITATLGKHDYLLEYDLPKINWKISQETRKIDAYTCQRATGEYRGRTYTAWFAPELSFSTGPWKLSGLPGMILEAEDDKKEVQFLFKSISKDSTEHTGTERTRVTKVSEAAFKKAEEAYFQDPVGTMQAQLSTTAPITLAYRDNSGKFATGEEAARLIEENKKKKETNFNNPIERTRK
jgi:GLPGLI family protein